MKKISIIFFVFVFILLSACDESILGTKPTSNFVDQDVWSNIELVQQYVNDIYRKNSWGWNQTSIRVDEARSYTSGNDFNVNNMIINPDNAGWGNWNGLYGTIRTCNIFLESIDKFSSNTTVDGVSLKDRLKGEVTFFRAWYYAQLINYFGGVPIIKTSYKLTDDFTVPRDSYEDCVKFICDDCDLAASLLPLMNTKDNYGRITKGAALALKSRVLLYAASDLHNTTRFSDFPNPELLGYVGGDRTQRWQAAKNAAKAVMDLGIYSLYKPNPASTGEATKNYEDLFVSKQSVEDIFVRFFSASVGLGVDAGQIWPCGWNGLERNGAINELIDAYEMADGTIFSRTNPAQELEPYKNRDPRFYATMLYEGAKLRPRPSNLVGYDPVGVLQVGTWEKWDKITNSIKYVYGLDGRYSIVYAGGYNNTGTSMLKYIDRNTDLKVSSAVDLTWRYIRYTEIILNYAEACIGLGQDAEARTYINMIRKKAAMPDITESGEALKTHYRNERRIELVFEDHRFFDVRRWLIGSEAYHDVHGVEVVYKLNPDHTTATIPTITPVTIMTGSWEDKGYFFPIARGEINKNPKLIQNPGY
jgi:hypothetical protein